MSSNFNFNVQQSQEPQEPQDPTQQPVQQQPPQPSPSTDDQSGQSSFSQVVNKKKGLGGGADAEEASGLLSSLFGNVGEEEEKPQSIFALSSSRSSTPSTTPLKKKSSTATQDGSIQGLSTGQNRVDTGAVQGDAGDAGSADDSDEKGKNTSNFNLGQETPTDIFQFTGMPNPTIQGPTFADTAGATSRTQDLADIATQMIQQMTVMQANGDTTTQLTLQYPPLFEGAQVNIMQTTTAPGQFNVTFQNLTPQAKYLMDMQQARTDLINNLQEKGYNVQIIITTTEIEKPEYKQELNPQQDQGKQQGDQGQQGQSGRGGKQ